MIPSLLSVGPVSGCKPRASGDDPNDWSYTLLTVE